MYGVENIVTSAQNEVYVVQMSSYADESLAVSAELLDVFTALQIQGEFETEAIRAVAISADCDIDWGVQVKWTDLEESESHGSCCRTFTRMCRCTC